MCLVYELFGQWKFSNLTFSVKNIMKKKSRKIRFNKSLDFWQYIANSNLMKAEIFSWLAVQSLANRYGCILKRHQFHTYRGFTFKKSDFDSLLLWANKKGDVKDLAACFDYKLLYCLQDSYIPPNAQAVFKMVLISMWHRCHTLRHIYFYKNQQN